MKKNFCNFHILYLQDPDASLGQRKGLSDKDVAKLNEMYEDDCNSFNIFNFDRFGNYLNEIIDYFQGTLDKIFN